MNTKMTTTCKRGLLAVLALLLLLLLFLFWPGDGALTALACGTPLASVSQTPAETIEDADAPLAAPAQAVPVQTGAKADIRPVAATTN